eukprot:gene9935-10955_t
MAEELRAAGLMIIRQLSKNTSFQYLMLQTSYGEHHWTPPKGHVDKGESDKDTAVRETQEEAGLGPSDYKIIPDFVDTINYEVRGKRKSVIYYLARLNIYDHPIVLSDEHQAYKWLDVKAACEFARYQEMQKTLLRAEDFLVKANI